ncbi:ABATE domain-containing protein [Nonomuraea sp. NPDC026600]|uniref:CGNR zinc finger domain-containing protein n=1 Tax=Nonomuraea sp. NPDC026600 TaxID=3155363 RepID=UPI0034022090
MTPPLSRDAADPEMSFPFIGGRPCLNFVATLGKRRTSPIERLPDPAALARWISQAQLCAGEDDMRVAAHDLTVARALREALYRLLLATMGEHAPDPADVQRVNEAAARPDLAPQLALPGTQGDEPQTILRWHAAHPVRAALAGVARDAVLLVGSPLLARVKECENPGCTLLFLDDSQARRRRWCSMERCGNLAKIAGYRSRARG